MTKYCHGCGSQEQVHDNCCDVCGERFCDECFDHDEGLCTKCLAKKGTEEGQ